MDISPYVVIKKFMYYTVFVKPMVSILKTNCFHIQRSHGSKWCNLSDFFNMDHHTLIVDLLFQNHHLFVNKNCLIWSPMMIMSNNLFHLCTWVMFYLSTSYTSHFFYLLVSNLLSLFCNLDSGFLTILNSFFSFTLNFSL